jgi:tetratricopeptide (TPR) repeat protein
MAEVYALNAFFWGALLWAAVRLRRTGAPRELYILALIAGLSLANHVTVVLFFPPLVLIGWPGRAKARALAGTLPLSAVLFLAGVSVNLYTPLRAAQKPFFNWNDPSTLGLAYAHVAAFQYRSHFLFYGVGGVKEALSHYGGAALSNVTPLAAFAVAGLAWLFVKRRSAVAAALILYYAGYLGYCLVYSIPDIYFYFIPLHLTVIFTAGLGVGAAARAIAERFTKARLAVSICAAAAIVSAAAWAFASNSPYGHRRGFIFAETYGRRLLAVLPARALFFSSADTNTFITCYNVHVRELRPDVAVVAQIRLAGPGYLTALARRNPDLIIPKEAEFRLLAEEAVRRGELPAGDGVIRSSDDFVLPEVVGRIIAGNARRRRIFWGLGDPGDKLRKYIIPYDLVMEVVEAEPEWDEIARRGEASVAALTNLTAGVERERPAELNDPAVRGILDLFYVGLSNHLLNWDIIEPQEKLFKSYVRLAPDDEEGYKNLAGIYMLSGRAAEAVEYYRRALEIAPGDAVARARLARALLASGQVREAAETVETLRGGTEGEGDYVRALIYREQGEIKKALAAFKAAEPHLADDGEFWWERGLTYEAARDHGAAVEAFGKALTFGPAVPPIYTARGENYLRLGNDARAKADFEAAISLNPGDGIAHYELACIYAGEGRTADALEHLEAAVRINPAFFVRAARADPDFENYRALPRFERIIKKYAGAPEE